MESFPISLALILHYHLTPRRSKRVLKEKGAVDELLHFYIGCTGWSMKEWVGKVYPTGTKAKGYLEHYSKQFNTIELNTTHYRTPDSKTIQKWKSESELQILSFVPKILQAISHSRNLGAGTGQIINFVEAIQGLEEKLGCSFMQFPPYFGVDKLPVLESFVKQFPTHIPLALELRHESWFKTIADQEARFFP